eukprot:5403752-Pyramimonas_sp.AAC.1
MKKNTDNTLTGEWIAVLERLIQLINAGKIGAKLRGAKRTQILSNITEARIKAVEVLKSGGTRVMEKFRAVDL